MKKLIALVLAAAVFAPTLAFAGASTDAALGLGAFAVFNQILGGVGIFHRGPVVAPPGGVRAAGSGGLRAAGPRLLRAAAPALRAGSSGDREAVSGVRAGAAARGRAPAARVLPARPRPKKGWCGPALGPASGLALLIA